MKNGSVTVWMNLLGFNRDNADKGASEYLGKVGFKPDGICALLCHPDFFNQHAGMEKEYTLPPDVCAYFAIPRNSERERQPWTNYDLRALVKNLSDEGVEFYAGVFGASLKNRYHREWVTDHPEVMRHGISGAEAASGIFCLKRFKDGSYYEDFFIDMACRTLVDYGMTGLHLADMFCPARGGMLHNIDFSTDFVDQFLTHTKLSLPEEIMRTMGRDDAESETLRSKYIYRNLRAEWAEFNVWRWEVFFKKLCTRLHAIGKKVSVLGMYCTDPFETVYCLGTDLRRIVDAGVDRITANILPTSVYFTVEDRPYYFNKYMAIAPTTAAHLGADNVGKLISMVGVHDPTEEWSMIHHQPTLHERDLYTMMAYQTVTADGIHRSLDGYMMCLGDGLTKADWEFERVRMEAAFSAEVKRSVSAAMLWSEAANRAMLCEFIKTRRWTPHKFFYELAEAGEHLGATVTPDALSGYEGAVLVPNIDMLPEDEIRAVAAYTGGAVIATATGGFDPAGYGIKPTAQFTDPHSALGYSAFVFGREVSAAIAEKATELCSEDDGTSDLSGDMLDVEEPSGTLVDTLVFNKVNKGFIKALALVISELKDSPFRINKPSIQLELTDGRYRLFLFNDTYYSYQRAFVETLANEVEVTTVSRFPILPPRFVTAPTETLHHFGKADDPRSSFEVKIQPGGVTIIDVKLK